jgi:hypothetical protein
MESREAPGPMTDLVVRAPAALGAWDKIGKFRMEKKRRCIRSTGTRIIVPICSPLKNAPVADGFPETLGRSIFFWGGEVVNASRMYIFLLKCFN